MLEEITAALNSKDYSTAQNLVNQLQAQDADNPWLPLYLGRLAEAKGNLEQATETYSQLLRNTTNIKIISSARQALQHLEENVQQKRQAELAQAKAQPNGDTLGVLVLEPLEPEKKLSAAQQFAKIMQIDPYTARLHLPTRTWRLYSSGLLGELRYYSKSLRDAEIPCFAVSIDDIEQIQVYQVSYFESMSPEASLVCLSPEEEEIKFTFNWSEVSQWVQGGLPIFEKITDTHKGKVEKKTDTLDYAYICDLHLPERNLILRLCDQHYQFQQGMTFLSGQSTARGKWNNIIKFLEQTLPQVTLWSDFKSFGEKAIDSPELLKRITPHTHLFRREESLWDEAFQLYSSLAFLKSMDG